MIKYCPKCRRETNVNKNGPRRGKQSYKCLSCGKQFYEDIKYPFEIRYIAINLIYLGLSYKDVMGLLNIKSRTTVYYWQKNRDEILCGADSQKVCAKLEVLKSKFEMLLEYKEQQQTVNRLYAQREQCQPLLANDETALRERHRLLILQLKKQEKAKPNNIFDEQKQQRKIQRIWIKLDEVEKLIEKAKPKNPDTLEEEIKIQSARLDELKEKCAGMEKYSYIAKDFLSAINQILDEFK